MTSRGTPRPATKMRAPPSMTLWMPRSTWPGMAVSRSTPNGLAVSGAHGGHLVGQFLGAHRAGAERADATGLADRGDEAVVADPAHAGEHDRVLDLQQFGETGAQSHARTVLPHPSPRSESQPHPSECHAARCESSPTTRVRVPSRTRIPGCESHSDGCVQRAARWDPVRSIGSDGGFPQIVHRSEKGVSHVVTEEATGWSSRTTTAWPPEPCSQLAGVSRRAAPRAVDDGLLEVRARARVPHRDRPAHRRWRRGASPSCLAFPRGFITGPTGGRLLDLRRMPTSDRIHFAVPTASTSAPFDGVRASADARRCAPPTSSSAGDGIRDREPGPLAFDLAADLSRARSPLGRRAAAEGAEDAPSQTL